MTDTNDIADELHVLLVEDDPADVILTKEAFEHYKIPNPLDVVNDGAEALKFLRRTGPHAHAMRPGLILLDLNLPGIDGREVLTPTSPSRSTSIGSWT